MSGLLKCLSGSALAALWLLGTATAEENIPAEAQAYRDHASEVIHLRAADNGPFRLTAHFKLYGMANGIVEGDYRLEWYEARRWREDVSAPGFAQARAVNGDEAWQQRTTAYLPVRIGQVLGILDLSYGLQPLTDGNVVKIKSRKKKGISSVCIEAVDARRVKSETCYDSETGGPLSRRWGDAPYQVLYGNYKKLGSKAFPSELRYLKEGKPEIDIAVTELTSDIQPAPDLFTRPTTATATTWSWCEALHNYRFPQSTQSEITNRFRAAIPRYLRQNGYMTRWHSSGMAIVSGVVGTDGKMRDLVVEQSQQPDFDALVTNILKQITVPPPICQGKPVEADMSVPFVYTIPYKIF